VKTRRQATLTESHQAKVTRASKPIGRARPVPDGIITVGISTNTPSSTSTSRITFQIIRTNTSTR
jgi:hypothetical protein